MKYFVQYIGFTLCLLFCCDSFAKALTLSEAQSLAVKNSAHVSALEAEVSEAKARLNTTRFQNRPVIGIAGGGQLEGTLKERDLLPLAYAYAGVNLYNGRQTRVLERISAVQVEKAQLAIPVKEFQLRKNIEELFAEIARRNGIISLKKKEAKTFESHRRKANDRRLAGLIGQTDVVEFDLRKNSLSNDIEALISEKDVYLRLLSILTGKSSVDNIEGYSLPEIKKVPDLSAKDLSNINLSSKVIAKELVGLSLEKDLQEAKWGPRIDLEGRAGYLPKEGDFDDKSPRFDIMVVAKMDLFNAPQRNAEFQEALEKKKKLESTIKAEDADARFMIDEIITTMKNQQKKLQILKSNRDSAERYYRSTLDEYERGIKNSPDVAHATEILFENDYKDIEIYYDWAMLKIRLENILIHEI